MSRRPHPNRRRKRPGRPPPYRYRGGGLPVRPNSFMDFNLRPIWDLILTGVRGRERRKFFNTSSGWAILGMALFGAGVGSSVAGPGGAIVGFIAGLVFMEQVMHKHRFIR